MQKSIKRPGGLSAATNYTKLLLHCDGSDDSTTFIDSSTNNHSLTKTMVGGGGIVALKTAQKKFGTASLYNQGTDACLSAEDSADWNFGTGDFTIDFWVRFNSLPSDIACFVSQYVDVNNRLQCYYTWPGPVLGFSVTSNGTVLAGYSVTTALSTNTWYHLAFVRNGTSFYIFKDGSKLTLTESVVIGTNAMPDFASILTFAARYTGAAIDRKLDVYFDELRISKGIARWVEDFTPPVAEYSLD
jgi:hypothetical protein